MMKKNSVSVIIPAYNAEKTIAAAVESVQKQTTPPQEIIIIDDGSTDATAETVQHCIDANLSDAMQIKLIRIPNGGVSHARNTGIQAAQSEYIAFLDSDDAWHPQKLEKQLDAFDAYPKAALVSTSSTVKTAFSGTTAVVPFLRLLIRNHVITSSAMVKAELAKALLFDETLKRAEDYNLWLRIAHGRQIVFIDEKLVFFAPKRTFGISGLSANFHALTLDEMRGFTKLLCTGVINPGQYVLAIAMSCAKYLRKCIIVYLIK